MSNAISPLPAAVTPPPPINLPTSDAGRKNHSTTESKSHLEHPEKPFFGHSMSKALSKLSSPEHAEKKNLKDIESLTRSLEKMFGAAEKVDHDSGEQEMKQGGLRRVSKDLSKLFKGLGMPPQMAKQFARGITQAIRDEEVEQIDFSMTATQAFNLEWQQTQQGYLPSGDGTGAAASVSNSFQLSAVQVRSLDFSLNLKSGEFSYSRSQIDSFSFSSSTSSSPGTTPAVEANPALADDTAANEPAGATEQPVANADTPPDTEETAARPTQPVDSDAALATMIQSDSKLLQISRIVQSSAIMQLKTVAGGDEAEAAEEELQLSGFELLKSMIDKLEDLSGEQRNLFEQQVQINNLRVEKDENEDNQLRFTLEALAPVGLTATDETGHATTLYPRDDGSLGKTVEGTLSKTA